MQSYLHPYSHAPTSSQAREIITINQLTDQCRENSVEILWVYKFTILGKKYYKL